MSSRTGRFAGARQFVAQSLLTFFLLAALTGWALRTSTARGGDLPQDYTSANALLAGESPYQPLGELLVRYGFIPVYSQIKVGTNPHPPGAVLLTLPYAGLGSED